MISEHPYGKDRQVQAGFVYRTLRNDESEVLSYQDYDRAEMRIGNRHRFSPAWKTGVEASFIRGTFDDVPADAEEAEGSVAVPREEEPTEDLWEYRGKAGVENSSFRHHTPALEYSYIGARYDDETQLDSDIHKFMFSWRYRYSRHLTVRLGAGPSYVRTEGHDDEWGGNGLAELSYLLRGGSISLSFEKGYEVDNFSGDEQRGAVEFWLARLGISYRLLDSLSCSARLAYKNEERLVTDDENGLPAEPLLETDTGGEDEQYKAGVGLSYDMSSSRAGLNYTYTREDTDVEGDDYQDHRVVATLTWQFAALRW